MRFFIAMAVAALGIGCYAIAAILYDRRRHVAGWLHRHWPGAPGGAGAAPAGAGARPAASTSPAEQPAVLYLPILGSVLLGTLLLVGSCIGLVAF
jgi:hypothetical protein